MRIHIMKSFMASHEAAWREFAADYDVRPALAFFRAYIADATSHLNKTRALTDMADDTVALAHESAAMLLDHHEARAPRRNTASFLRGICRTVPLSGFPTIGALDGQSRVHVWRPPLAKHRDRVRAVSVYLHYPANARVTLFVWIGAAHDLKHCLEAFERPDFKWRNLGGNYGAWLEARRAREG